VKLPPREKPLLSEAKPTQQCFFQGAAISPVSLQNIVIFFCYTECLSIGEPYAQQFCAVNIFFIVTCCHALLTVAMNCYLEGVIYARVE
jgi:hypothetical protein